MNENRNISVLKLNADHTILSVIDLHKTLTMYVKDKINVVKTDGDVKVHPRVDFKGIPLIVSLKNYVYVPYREIKLNRKRVFQRDRYRCQYCNTRLTRDTATIDHVVPKCKPDFPGNTWENMVASCKRCNNTKDNRTPRQAGMQLIRKPFAPHFEHFFKIKEEWKEFINLDEDEIMAEEINNETQN